MLVKLYYFCRNWMHPDNLNYTPKIYGDTQNVTNVFRLYANPIKIN